jgi:hypothetical protein
VELTNNREKQKQPAFGIFKSVIFKRDNIFGKEIVYTETAPDYKKKTLQAIIKGK